MTELLNITTEGRLGVITLDRPGAINALNGEMIAAITQTLESWRGDDAIRAVLFEGNGARGFCAGGDVRAVRELVIEGRKAEAEAFFAREYRLNGIIAEYPKPIIALTHGSVMGGGIGIAGHAGFRITTEDSRFAMPEAAIGFVVDTGVNAILAKAPEHRALLFLLTGLPVGPADALALGLTDCVIALERRDAVRTGLVAAADAGRIETAIVALMHSETIEAGEPSLCREADALAPVLLLEDAEAIVAGVVELAGENETRSPVRDTLLSRSPTSLEAILQSHRRARKAATTAEVLGLDLELARLMITQPDFAEGVRAVLVDKDMAPRWQPSSFENVRKDLIGLALSSAKP